MNSLIALLFTIFISWQVSSAYAGKRSDNRNTIQKLNLTEDQDTSFLNQVLYNGAVWKGLYYNVYGTEFMLDDKWTNANLSIEGINFANLELKYDIYSDEILVNYNNIRIIVLNQELLDSFSLYLPDKTYHFRNFRGENSLNGYYEILFDGNSKLLKKWHKKRAQFVIEAKYDEFQADHQLLLIINGNNHEISGKRDLLRIMSDKKDYIKSFIRMEKIKIDIDAPETILPLIKYYDSLQAQ